MCYSRLFAIVLSDSLLPPPLYHKTPTPQFYRLDVSSLIFSLRLTLLDLDAFPTEIVRVWSTALAKSQLLGLPVELFLLLLGGCVDEVWPYEEVGTHDEDDADPARGGHLVVRLDRVVDEAVLPFHHVLDDVVHCVHGDGVIGESQEDVIGARYALRVVLCSVRSRWQW